MAPPPTITVFDTVYDNNGKALVNTTVTCVLESTLETYAGGLITARTQTTLTDSTGRFQFTVICNDLLSPSNSVYTINIPSIGRSYQIAPQSANGSSQQTTALNVIVNTPTALAPATSNITGPLTVAGLLTAASAAITGALSAASAAITALVAATLHVTGIAQFDASVNFGPTPTSGATQLVDGKLLAYGAAPSPSNPLGGTIVTAVSVVGNDRRGQITVTTGATPPGANSGLTVLTYSTTYPGTAYAVVCSGNSNPVIAFSALLAAASFTVYNGTLLAGLGNYFINYGVTG